MELSGNAFKLITCLLAKYRPAQPNSFLAGGKRIANMIGVSEKTACKLVDELIKRGHLREERKGTNTGMLRTRERVVSLTRYDSEMNAGDPELPLKIWRTRKKSPERPVKKSGSELACNLRKDSRGNTTQGKASKSDTHI